MIKLKCSVNLCILYNLYINEVVLLFVAIIYKATITINHCIIIVNLYQIFTLHCIFLLQFGNRKTFS